MPCERDYGEMILGKLGTYWCVMEDFWTFWGHIGCHGGICKTVTFKEDKTCNM